MHKNQKRKILCIVQLPPPVHGASVMNSHVVNSKIIKKHFSIDVINLQFAKSLEDIKQFSILKFLKAILFGIEIIKKVILQKPDLVYYNLSPTGYAFYRDAIYVFLLKLFNQKIVFHMHGKGIKINVTKNIFNKRLYKLVLRKTYVICLTKSLVSDVSDVYHETPFLVPNGIEVQQQIKNPISRFNESLPKILFLSNYKREKGILVLIDALEILKDRGYKYEARLVGAPSDISIKTLEQIIDRKELTKFTEIIGPLYGEDKYREFQKADIFVFPTYYLNETFGLVNLEAMQYSLPVISTSEGGISDVVIDGETGFIVEPESPEMLANRIAMLLENKKLRVEMGIKGYERFKNNYTLNHFENNMLRTFQNILGTA